MTRSTVLFLLALGLGAVGCKGKSDPGPEASAVASSAVTAPGQGKMVHCPNAVVGSSTAFKDVDGGVEITVTAQGEAAATDIRARARHLAEAAKDMSAGQKRHDGSGQGGGGLGRCPVVVRDTLIDVADVEGGARITVKAKDAAETDWLRREAKAREADLEAEPGGRRTRR